MEKMYIICECQIRILAVVKIDKFVVLFIV